MLTHARRANLVAGFAIALLLPLMGCGSGDGKVSILLTDAPGDGVETAVVTISQIYLQGGDEEGGRVVLRDEPVTVSLLDLANSTSELVSEAVVPDGDYSQLRFVITGGYLETKNADGSTSIFATSNNYAGLPEGAVVAGQLHMPSYGSSGLKVKFDEKLTIEGEQKILLVDFDVAQSFGKEAGNSGRWVMSPVIKAAEVTASASITVEVKLGAGVVLPTVEGTAVTLADFHAVLINDAGSRETLPLTDENADGTFEATFKFLIPGTFQVDVESPASVSISTTPGDPVTVQLASGRDSTQAFVVSGAQPQ
ncbi:DUF4382 domain-containing protein [Myxococcus llanfairpwllgwyngyllgogerychwyrndrobwllllantysiliogogogochensis]|uniref:DUF4382 domain-containing protein n=1 Tax=Myxococcus llanfairpwllgwyngyllgogerychwyrndrobwllllantysiliogogogochensis TaxID=2590453 RepID=A0A540X440_9BACT|nr:DUF4382 domain-containing protein [Myxococcus llanfairpwllgwyngyllgogerychwyrndrobwllllantysiliogogogochensis]TQF16031.1 DUF4382 domain-containing protein [Myxococcus llanfairpwllgwyngyllgogerychwyrndrobwllllantysiliogogogochensis]